MIFIQPGTMQVCTSHIWWAAWKVNDCSNHNDYSDSCVPCATLHTDHNLMFLPVIQKHSWYKHNTIMAFLVFFNLLFHFVVIHNQISCPTKCSKMQQKRQKRGKQHLKCSCTPCKFFPHTAGLTFKPTVHYPYLKKRCIDHNIIHFKSKNFLCWPCSPSGFRHKPQYFQNYAIKNKKEEHYFIHKSFTSYRIK